MLRLTMLIFVMIASLLPVVSAVASPRPDIPIAAGLMNLSISNLGYVGNGFKQGYSSCEYPQFSHVEHLFLGGLWVGAVTANDTIRVSTGAQDVSNFAAGENIREFEDFTVLGSDSVFVWVWTNLQNAPGDPLDPSTPSYHPDALANLHVGVQFDDYTSPESSVHVPLGLKVTMRALAWGTPYADDFVILDYTIVNISGQELSDVYVGYWNDTTIGNTQVNDPYGSGTGTSWNYYDDMNGGWRPGDVEGDESIWMMYEHDDDGDDEMATSWIGTRLLGMNPAPEPAVDMPPVSYNAWGFRDVPAEDDVYIDLDTLEELPGKYQLMSNGDWDVGEQEVEDFTRPHDWIAMLSTGPFHYLAPDDSINVTFAVVCGVDSLSLMANSKVAQLAYDEGFQIASGPPSPILEITYEDNSVILSWAPGDSLYQNELEEWVPLLDDDARRQPEHHISRVTGSEDFQGYRVYRFQGNEFSEDPLDEAMLVAEFDKVDGVGFDTGLPPLNASGLRSFMDTNLLDGFPYYYAVLSYAAPNAAQDLPELPSGFWENGLKIYPGPAPVTSGSERTVGVFPNPYRAGSHFDGRVGERELNRKLWFTGLPARCTIKIFNLAGDLVKTLYHDDPASGMEPWDLLSEPVRTIATGLYVYVVENPVDGSIQRGKLVVIK